VESVSALWQTIKEFLFPARDRSPELEDQVAFLTLDLEVLKKKVSLVQDARKNGLSDIPSSEQKSPDGTEQAIRNEVMSRVADAKTKASAHLDNLKAAIKRRQLAPSVERCKTIARQFVDAFDAENERLDRDRPRMEGELSALQKEVDEYRKIYGLRRGPKLIDEEDRNNALSLLLIFALAQLVANALLFSEGSLYGLSFGLLLALILAFFDIVIHFNLGRIGARVEAPDPTSKWHGGLGIVMALLTVIAWNLGLVHLRLVSRAIDGSEPVGWDEWLPSLMGNTLGFVDFLSWALLVIGVACSFLALRSGWLWDEPIPVFRENGRRMARLTFDISELTEKRAGLRAQLREDYLSELDQMDKDAKNHVGLVTGHVSGIKAKVEHFATYKLRSEEVYKALIGAYRIENQRARESPAPIFFGAPIGDLSPDAHQLDLPERDFGRFVKEAERQYEELKRELPQARKRLLGISDEGGS